MIVALHNHNISTSDFMYILVDADDGNPRTLPIIVML
jgi:hypothetical protein